MEKKAEENADDEQEQKKYMRNLSIQTRRGKRGRKERRKKGRNGKMREEGREDMGRMFA